MILASRCNQIYHQNKIHTSCEKRVINTRLPHVTYRNNHQRRLPPVAAERPQAPSACFRLPSPPGAQTASQHCLPSRRLEPQPGACPQPMNQAGRLAGQAGGQGSGDCPFATPALPPLLRTPICCPQESGPPTSGIGQKTPGLVAAPERRRASPRRANARRPQVTQTSPVPPNETVHLRGRTRGNRVGAELVPLPAARFQQRLAVKTSWNNSQSYAMPSRTRPGEEMGSLPQDKKRKEEENRRRQSERSELAESQRLRQSPRPSPSTAQSLRPLPPPPCCGWGGGAGGAGDVDPGLLGA